MADKNKEKGDSSVLERQKTEEPRKWKVVLLNDNYTSMEFVVLVLKTVFRHSSAQATRVMLHIHNSGTGVAGVFSREVAETKIEQVHAMAADAGHPLQCDMEPEG